VSRGETVDPYLPGHGSNDYSVTRYDLDLDYRVATNRLAGRARLSIVAARELTRVSLDLAGLRVDKVVADTRRVTRHTHRAGKLQVSLDRALRPGDEAVLTIGYSGAPRPSDGSWGEVGWEELTDGVIVAGQPDGAPSWYPCNDRPGDKASYRVAVTTESPYTVVANGVPVERRVGGSRTTWVFDQPEPMSTYLATVQIGRYVEWRAPGAPVPLAVVAPPRLRQVAEHDLARQAQMVSVFEELFGPYPFARYTAVVTDDDLEIPLEAQGLSVFGANHLDGRRGSERLVAHELAHQWFGNSLTVGRWQDIWLHEGFACYAEWLWAEHADGPTADVAAARAWARLDRLPQDLVLADPGPALMFDDRLYKRGALLLHALRRTVGDACFFDLLREWAAEHRHGTVSTDVFLAHTARRAGAGASGMLAAWLDQPALPALPPLPAG
jgi:aminopeptidase N